MSDPMQEIRNSFFIECDELLEGLQDALASMEGGDHTSETINVAFRAVHSIKGGAGAFGLDQLVGFAHTFETVMDDVRSGSLAIEEHIVQLFFQCADMLSDLVRVSRDGELLSEDEMAPLVNQLKALAGEDGAGGAEPEPEVDFQPMGIAIDLPDLDLSDAPEEESTPADEAEDLDAEDADGDADEKEDDDASALSHLFEVIFRPEPELYRSGNDPLFLLRALEALGRAETTCTVAPSPDLAEYGPNTSLLSWRIELSTNVDAAAIREVFDFVDGLCLLEVSKVGADAGTEADEAPAPAPEPAPEPAVAAAPAVAAPKKSAVPTPPAPKPAAPMPAATREEPARPAPKPDADAEKAGGSGQASQPGPTVRVDLDRVDRLVNLVGELVINQAMLSQSIAATGLSGNSKIATGLDEFQQLTRDIQDSVMMIRAQPVKSLFQRMGRIVREASASVNKTVRLRTEGESTEIDKTVIERLADPLTHMIRNAVDHGLESTEMRLAAGKSAEGHVTLSASHRSGRVVIEITDDGGGIDRDRVKSIAESKGLIAPGQDLSETEIDNLLFLPGFSTAKEISNLSGRGVGMDVVKNAISSLGGRIAISSQSGIGTTFSISLPLTLAVLDGMVVTVADETLVLPLSSVSETLSIGPEDVRGLGPSTQVIRVRDVFVPLIDLGTELGYSQPRSKYDGAIVLLITQEDGKRAALVVDGIEDQRQVVIKGLEESYGRVPGVAAATILGDGQIALILDPTDLLANASGRSRPEPNLAIA